jgi:hypothetical protein
MTTVTTVLIFCLPFVLGSVWAIVDAGLREFGSPARRALWVLVAAVPFVGVLVYLAVGRRQGRRAARPSISD